MIHSYIFLERIRDDGDHGTRFRQMMDFINNSTLPDSQVCSAASCEVANLWTLKLWFCKEKY